MLCGGQLFDDKAFLPLIFYYHEEKTPERNRKLLIIFSFISFWVFLMVPLGYNLVLMLWLKTILSEKSQPHINFKIVPSG